MFDRLPSDLSLLLFPTGLEVEAKAAWGPPCLYWLCGGRWGQNRSAVAPPFWAPAQFLQVGNWPCVHHSLPSQVILLAFSPSMLAYPGASPPGPPALDVGELQADCSSPPSIFPTYSLGSLLNHYHYWVTLHKTNSWLAEHGDQGLRSIVLILHMHPQYVCRAPFWEPGF